MLNCKKTNCRLFGVRTLASMTFVGSRTSHMYTLVRSLVGYEIPHVFCLKSIVACFVLLLMQSGVVENNGS